MTKEQMLDIINFKIARTSQSDEGTGYFLPIEKNDVRNFIIKVGGEDLQGMEDDIEIVGHLWKIKGEPLDKQSEECITYIHSLIK